MLFFCYKCKKELKAGALFRQNEKGIQGIWACAACNTQPIDPLIEEITNIIEGRDYDKAG